MHQADKTVYELYQESHPFGKPEDPLPTHSEFQETVNDYLENLSPKKRDKALVDHPRYRLIQEVLKNPRNTTVSTAQFRFWVKKMFQIQQNIVIHDNKPVAMKEQIYDILVRAHKDAHHGGRDKTSAIVRNQFSWIPKELVARFVRQCPTCISRRNGSQPLSAYSNKTLNPPHYGSYDYYSRQNTDVALMYSGKGTDSDVSTPSTENTFIKQRLSPCYMSSPPKVNSSLFQNTLFESPNFELAEQQNAFYRRKECINYPTNNYYMSCNQPVHNSDFGIVKEEYLSRQDILSHSSEL